MFTSTYLPQCSVGTDPRDLEKGIPLWLLFMVAMPEHPAPMQKEPSESRIRIGRDAPHQEGRRIDGSFQYLKQAIFRIPMGKGIYK
jgi:hypothetical protein